MLLVIQYAMSKPLTQCRAVVGDDPKWWARFLTAKEKKEKLVVKAVHKLFRCAQCSRDVLVHHDYIDHGTLGSASDNEDKGRTCAPECAYSFLKGEWWQHVEGFQDLHRTTLILVGKAGTATPGPADWAEAHNVAFAVNEVRNPII